MNALAFIRAVHGDNRLRLERRRDLARDLLLWARNRALQPREALLTRRFRDETQPVVFIVGWPRSGTTLLHQLLAAQLEVGYISNRVARYWMAPLHATRRFAGELADAAPGELRSELGATQGAAAPHEFGWFWTFHSGAHASDDLTTAQLGAIDWAPLRRELYGLAGWYQRPLVLKNLNHTAYHVSHLHAVLPNVRFLYVRRDPRFSVQSILESRAKRYGSEQVWWSIRPRDVAEWHARPPLEQVCHQVSDVAHKLDSQLAALPPQSWRSIDYERLVEHPADTLREISAFLATPLRQPARLDALTLKSGNRQRMDDARFAEIERLL